MKIILILTTFVLFSCNYIEIYPKKSRSKKTLSTYSHTQEGYIGHVTSDPIYVFTANHKTYSYVQNGYKAAAGDAITVIYDTIHPNRFRDLYDEPAFLPKQVTRKAVGQIKSIKMYNFYDFIGDGSKFRMINFTLGKDTIGLGSQYIRKKTLKNHPEIIPGSYYEIEYQPCCIYNAIIHLDHPIPKDSVQFKMKYYELINHKLDSAVHYKSEHNKNLHHSNKSLK